jgi:Domain of unknown function (DUF4388)
MKVPSCRVTSVGELSLWGKQFLGSLQSANLVDITYEPSFQKFASSPLVSELQVVFLENTADSRQQILKLRQQNRRLYLIWFGRNFAKEDLFFAFDQRLFYVFENMRPDDPRLLNGMQKIVTSVDNTGALEQVLRSVKGILIQAENENSLPIVAEIKTALSKIERFGLQSEFSGSFGEIPLSDVKLPFHKAQGFGDALTTVHDLERTGLLWIKGFVPGEEGRVEFLQGKILSASTGEVRGLKAIHRMFLWDELRFLFTRKDPRESNLVDHINLSMKFICNEGEQLKRRFEKVRRELPPGDLKLELDPNSLHAGVHLGLEEFSTLASVVEFNNVARVLDYNPLPDVALYESLIQLRRHNMIRVVA